MQGVRIPSPMIIEVPIMVATRRKYLKNRLFSTTDFSFDALLSLLLGISSS